MPYSSIIQLPAEINEVIEQKMASFIKQSSPFDLGQALLAEEPIEPIYQTLRDELDRAEPEHQARFLQTEFNRLYQQQLARDEAENAAASGYEYKEKEHQLTAGCRKLTTESHRNKDRLDILKRKLAAKEAEQRQVSESYSSVMNKIHQLESEKYGLIGTPAQIQTKKRALDNEILHREQEKLRYQKQLKKIQQEMSALGEERTTLTNKNKDNQSEVRRMETEVEQLIFNRNAQKEAREQRAQARARFAQNSGDESLKRHCLSDSANEELERHIADNTEAMATQRHKMEEDFLQAIYGRFVDAVEKQTTSEQIKTMVQHLRSCFEYRQQRDAFSEMLVVGRRQLMDYQAELKPLLAYKSQCSRQKLNRTKRKTEYFLYAGLLLLSGVMMIIPAITSGALLSPLMFFAGFSLLMGGIFLALALQERSKEDSLDKSIQSLDGSSSKTGQDGILAKLARVKVLEEQIQNNEKQFKEQARQAREAKGRAETILKSEPVSSSAAKGSGFFAESSSKEAGPSVSLASDSLNNSIH